MPDTKVAVVVACATSGCGRILAEVETTGAADHRDIRFRPGVQWQAHGTSIVVACPRHGPGQFTYSDLVEARSARRDSRKPARLNIACG